jgi:hypothetical protein
MSDDGMTHGQFQEALEPWLERWIIHGYVIDDGVEGTTITTSDVYEWAPGGFFLLHTAYGRIDEFDVGGTEIIGYDAPTGGYVSYFFDSQGNVMKSALTVRSDTWTYQGDTTRATVVFSASNRIQTVVHERTNDGLTYSTSMNVTLRKVA